jgi:hypothetical protein
MSVADVVETRVKATQFMHADLNSYLLVLTFAMLGIFAMIAFIPSKKG